MEFDPARFKSQLISRGLLKKDRVEASYVDIVAILQECAQPPSMNATIKQQSKSLENLPPRKRAVVGKALELSQMANVICSSTNLSVLPEPRYPYRQRKSKYGHSAPADVFVVEQEWADLSKNQLIYLPWLYQVDEPLYQALFHLARARNQAIEDYVWNLGIWAPKRLRDPTLIKNPKRELFVQAHSILNIATLHAGNRD